MKYANRVRTRQTFTLKALEHQGAREGHERRVFYVKGEEGLLAVWGDSGREMSHIEELERHIATSGYPVTIECDWIPPDDYEAERFGHRYWVAQTDYFKVITENT